MVDLANLAYEARTIPVDELRSSPVNPRSDFDQAALDDLAEDLKAHGMLEPIIVRPTDQSGVYEIVAGERRYRAAKQAKLRHVPVMIASAKLSDAEAIELAIAENLRRENLDPIETANAYERLAAESGRTQEQIGELVGKSQPVVANTLRLLRLPESVKALIKGGELSAAHGVQIVRFADRPAVAEAIAERAVETKSNAKDLEQPLPFARELVRLGLAFEVPADLPFARKLQSDKGAYVKAAPGSAFGYYLDPERYRTLRKEADEEAARKTQRAKSAAVGQTVDGKPLKAAPKRLLPMLADFESGTVVQLPDYLPAGCSPECPCRGRALLSDGNTETAICTDPRRFRRLERADGKNVDKQIAAQKAALDDWLVAHTRTLSNFSGSEMAVIFGRDVIQWYGTPAMRALAQLGIELPDASPAGDEFLDWLAHLEPGRLLQLAFVNAIRSEINTDSREMALTKWYTRQVGADLPEPIIEPDAPEHAEEGESGEDDSTDGDEVREAAERISDALDGFREDIAEAVGVGAGDDWPPADKAAE